MSSSALPAKAVGPGAAPGVLAALFVASVASLVQSYVWIKLLFLALFLGVAAASVARRRAGLVYPRLVAFYLAISAAGAMWAVVGLLHPNNYAQGVVDAVRLYVIWSIAFIVLFSLLRASASLRVIHRSLVLAGILIAAINLVGLADMLLGWGLVSDSVRKALDQYIGIHEGYIQITSQNIGALFVIVPYLLAIQMRRDAGRVNSRLMKLSLALALLLALLSGRRALWLVVALTPCTILIVALLAGSVRLIRPRLRRFLVAYTLAIAVAPAATPMLPETLRQSPTVEHVLAAFSSEDERTIQRPFLLAAFARSPVLGSGFGAYAGYVRSEARPWTYELTYFQLLLTVGLTGVVVLGTLFGAYFALVFRLLRQFSDGSVIPFGMVVGLCSLMLGAYSDPYFGSFDYLFYVGLLPYLATFRSGFNDPAPQAAGAAG